MHVESCCKRVAKIDNCEVVSVDRELRRKIHERRPGVQGRKVCGVRRLHPHAIGRSELQQRYSREMDGQTVFLAEGDLSRRYEVWPIVGGSSKAGRTVYACTSQLGTRRNHADVSIDLLA